MLFLYKNPLRMSKHVSQTKTKPEKECTEFPRVTELPWYSYTYT